MAEVTYRIDTGYVVDVFNFFFYFSPEIACVESSILFVFQVFSEVADGVTF